MIYFLVSVALIFLLYGLRERMRKHAAWEGTITDKSSKREWYGYHGNKLPTFYVTVKLDDGQTKKLRIGQQLYDDASIGDRITKRSGENDPVKV